MKNVFIVSMLFISFFVLSVSTVIAQKKIPVEKHETAFYSNFYVMQVKPMQFKITYNFPVRDRVQVRILDVNRNILFGENTLVYKKYEKYFDLSVFADGQYTFELVDGEEKFSHSISVLTKTTRMVTAKNDQIIIVAGF